MPDVVEQLVDGREIIFSQTKDLKKSFFPQVKEMFCTVAQQVGEKSCTSRRPLRYCHNRYHRCLLIRLTLDDLTELNDNSRQLYPKAFPGAKFRESKSTWHFPSGATIWFTYLDKDKDVTRFQGQAFNWIGIDEITQYPSPYVWDYLRSRLRTTDPELQEHLYMRCTANPGGVGGWWVKKMYIDPSEHINFPAMDIETGKPLCALKVTKRKASHFFIVGSSPHV